LYYDIVNFIKRTYLWATDNIVRASEWGYRQGQKVSRFIKEKYVVVRNWTNEKVYTPTNNLVKKIITKIKNLLKKIWNFIKQKATIAKDKAVYVGNLFIEKVAKPLYLSIVEKLIALKKVIVLVFKAIMNSFKAIYNLIVEVLLTGIKAIRGLLSNFNKLYFMFLLHSRRVLMKFGIIGELIFTVIGLIVMCSPSLICYYFYS
jgi:hypothetical protein